MHEFLGTSPAEIMTTIFTLITTIILSTVFGGWVFYDAKKRKYSSLSASIWGIATFFIWFLFLPVWFLTRPNIDPATGEIIASPNTGANKTVKGCAFGCLGFLIFMLIIGAGVCIFAYLRLNR